MAGPVFVCNNFWQSVADHHVDLPHETRHLYAPRPFAPGAVRDGDVVFVKTDLLDAFVDGLLPRIAASRFVLVTGHSDLCPSPRAMAAVHADPRIARWYAANALWADHKTTPIPIGLSEPDRAFGDQRIVAECAAAAAGATKAPRALLPPTGPTHPLRQALQGYEHPLLDRVGGRLSYRDYLTALAGHAFAVCPRGNGADVHRVHEALLMRAVPIYVSDQVPALFAGLPVIVVQSLPELTRVLDGLAGPAGLAGLAGLAADADWEAVQRYMLADRVADVYGLRPAAGRSAREGGLEAGDVLAVGHAAGGGGHGGQVGGLRVDQASPQDQHLAWWRGGGGGGAPREQQGEIGRAHV